MTAAKNVIFLDGHSSHMFNLEFLSECMKSDKDITVVILPSGQTGKLQPMDLKVYGPVKKYWRDYLRLMTLIAEEEVNKQNFARHLVKKWDEFNMAANIISGFASSGIYPFNPDAVCRAYVVCGVVSYTLVFAELNGEQKCTILKPVSMDTTNPWKEFNVSAPS
ncbi:uncharacterized protein LOC129582820 [Paramacrobiotus metropolitanus]|uniref:uncharacterized protein LOC129582820 n=1 Tax=Paramacrobiotus metropolitanus TaxID=2943436 RepID=UPI00244578BA|nr:uncharacterized protein LOC129582820 [Paramacrobiotus metropolitanus]